MSTATTKYLSCAETAKLLRVALKAAFPGVKFSVRSDTYAGGASIDVKWTDGPTDAEVEKVTYLYTGATFDGMTDMKSYHSRLVAFGDDVQDVHFGADFIFTRRELSPAYAQKLAEAAPGLFHLDGPLDLERWYEGEACEFGVFQQGNGHALVRWLSRHVKP